MIARWGERGIEPEAPVRILVLTDNNGTEWRIHDVSGGLAVSRGGDATIYPMSANRFLIKGEN